ncbi:hypothetical protein BWD42_13005 [Sphingobacterium sp. CZ-UAM]|uniref:hypothetical protein n=1 Tax=Sphingobacterium sp. CZ-UAM TaxID=1933868 RepID=UPI0009863F77|nr:hypothetical protein [Sphingobacterium sp. CZ-UAM]OOG18180.1 hypothetical protein BWD42_13005 [Sphingobacterium sp. CZ-UAM]
MENNEHFLTLLEGHPLFRSIIKNQDFSGVNLKDQVYTEELGNIYNFKSMQVGKHIFKNVQVSISPQITMVTIVTDETIFFDEPVRYFNQEGYIQEAEPYLVDSVPVIELRRKLRTFQMLGRTTRLSVYKCIVYGCMIKFSFPNESKIKEIMDNFDF